MRIPWWVTEQYWLVSLLVRMGYVVQRYQNYEEGDPIGSDATYRLTGQRVARIWRQR